MARNSFPERPDLTEEALRRAYRQAFTLGGHDRLLADDEVLDRHGAVRDLLLCAGRRLPDVIEFATLLDEGSESELPRRRAAELLQQAVAGEIRFVARAVEAHARENGYDVAQPLEKVWLGASATLAGAAEDAGSSERGLVSTAKWAWAATCDAHASDGVEREQVPERLSEALAVWLAIYVAARELAVSGGA